MAQPQRRLQKTNKDQYTITIPKTLVEVLGWDAQDQLSFSLQGDSLVLSKIDPPLTEEKNVNPVNHSKKANPPEVEQ